MLLGSVTYRYPTKGDLVVALMERAVDATSVDVLEAIEHASDPIERMRLALRAHLEALLVGDDAVYVLLFDWPRLDEATRSRLVEQRRRYEAIWTGLIYAAAASGQLIAGLDLSLVRKLVFGAANSVAFWYRAGGSRSPEEIADAFSALIAFGLVADAVRPSDTLGRYRELGALRPDADVPGEVARASAPKGTDDFGWLQSPEPSWRPVGLSRWPSENFLHSDAPGKRVSLRYYREEPGGSFRAKVLFGRLAQGHPGHCHGGSLSAVLDEVMGFTAWLSGSIVVAAELTIRYRSMVPVGARAIAEAEVIRLEGRKIWTRSLLRSPGGTLYCEGEALYIAVHAEQFGEFADRVKEIRDAFEPSC